MEASPPNAAADSLVISIVIIIIKEEYLIQQAFAIIKTSFFWQKIHKNTIPEDETHFLCINECMTS